MTVVTDFWMPPYKQRSGCPTSGERETLNVPV